MIHYWTGIFENNDIKITDWQPERESAEYHACDIKIDGKIAKFRVGKITPTKNGQFVTLWKRLDSGTIAPFDSSGGIDFVIIAVKKENLIGHFLFPKKVLVDKKIFTDKSEGKRAFRVYPPWDIAQNSQSKKSQEWQLRYFSSLKV